MDRQSTVLPLYELAIIRYNVCSIVGQLDQTYLPLVSVRTVVYFEQGRRIELL